MRQIERFWSAIETVPGLTCLLCEWQKLLGDDLEIGNRFLRPTAALARYYPCPNPAGDGCPRNVVIHGPDDVVAACGDSSRRCETIPLRRDDLILYQLDVMDFAFQLAGALEFVPRFQQASAPATWRVGECERGTVGQRWPVYLTIPSSEDGLGDVVKELLLSPDRPFVLVAPTSTFLLPRSRELLGNAGCGFAALENLIRVSGEQKFAATVRLSVFIAADADSEEYIFRREGDKWNVRFRGVTKYLNDAGGLRYLKVLLENPGREYLPAVLPIEAGEGSVPQHPSQDEGLDANRGGSTGEVLDKEGRKQLRDRLKVISDELADADERFDSLKAETLRAEKEWIEDALISAEGLHGRPRHQRDPRKRERDRVTAATARSREKIAEKHPLLAEHLQSALQGGKLWSYRPEHPVPWKF